MLIRGSVLIFFVCLIGFGTPQTTFSSELEHCAADLAKMAAPKKIPVYDRVAMAKGYTAQAVEFGLAHPELKDEVERMWERARKLIPIYERKLDDAENSNDETYEGYLQQYADAGNLVQFYSEMLQAMKEPNLERFDDDRARVLGLPNFTELSSVERLPEDFIKKHRKDPAIAQKALQLSEFFSRRAEEYRQLADKLTLQRPPVEFQEFNVRITTEKSQFAEKRSRFYSLLAIQLLK